MDQARNFAQANRSSIINIVYIVAAVVLVYYLVMFYLSGSDQVDTTVLKNKMKTGEIKDKAYVVVKKDDTSGRFKNEYTVSTWVYINNYSTGNNYQGILALFDSPATNGNVNALLTIGLHSTKPRMIIRAGKIKNETADPFTQYGYTAPGPTSATGSYVFSGSRTLGDDLPACDVMDIDLQRWLNVTVSVNARIMDVYMDGKLARSCILPNVQDVGDNGMQAVLLCSPNPFDGYVSCVTVSNYAVTPDVIYGRYQAGPYSSTGFLDYLVDKLGIRISYTSSTGAAEEVNLLRSLGLSS